MLWINHRTQQSRQTAQAAARQAACDLMKTFGSYDFDNLDAYNAAVLKGVTGSFQKTWQSDFPTLRDTITQTHTRSIVTDIQCFLKTADANTAQIGVVMSEKIVNDTEKEGVTNQEPVTVTMTKVGGRWLCSEMQKMGS
jgi:serine/threonine-protein kinase